MPYTSGPTTPTHLALVGTGVEQTVAIPANCKYFTVKAVGGSATFSFTALASGTGTPIDNGEVRTFVDANRGGRNMYFTHSAAVTLHFDYFYDSGV